MEYLAEIIVDVPTMQVDQPYTYLIPPQWQDIIEIGMRVEVPFGTRHVQGFVVDLIDAAAKEPSLQLKPIVRLMDLSPVLNQEMLLLADYMQEQSFAFKISCLQTMLPSMLKASYQKKIVLLEPEHEAKERYFSQQTVLDYEEAEGKGWLSELKKLRDQKIVDIQYVVQGKEKIKKRREVVCQQSKEQLRALRETVRKNALRQQQLLTLLMENPRQTIDFYKEQGITTVHLNEAQKQGWLTFEMVEVYRDPYAHRTFSKTEPLALNKEQRICVDAILESANGPSETFLLEGITGSGKTEVYLQVISEVLSQGKTAMMLVPEIALTPQMVERFKQRFGESVAVLHSGLSAGEKYDEWRKIERKEAQVVVGARSAIFAPLDAIGVIIVDEEHETTYKQEEMPRYHARDLAIWRGRYHQCPVVLGSATPSLESRARVQKHHYRHLLLTQRANPMAQLPQVEVVDLKEEYAQKNMSTFSRILQEKIQDRLEKEEQVVLLLNRRGYSSFMMCRDCGYVLPCPNCDISLTLHMDTKKMRCHYCGHEEAIPQKCPSCHRNKIRYYGTGTQKVEEELQQLFPSAKILRMDVDTTRKKGAHEKMLQEFGEKKANILLGTQMIAKGLDFPDVTLVGVLNADTALNLPDFRASERTFQLLTQVSGRAGRAEKAGEVVIQTFNPEHHAIYLAKKQDYEQFYRQEMFLRHQSGYPPYYFTVKITCSHQEEQVAAKRMFEISEQLKVVLSPTSILLGPVPANIARTKNRYHYQLLIKYKKEPQLQTLLRQILEDSQMDQRQGLYVSIDNEPLQFV